MAVIATDLIKIVRYELRLSHFNKLVLWIKATYKDWDTNTGMSTEREYTIWKKASKRQVLEYLRNNSGGNIEKV